MIYDNNTPLIHTTMANLPSTCQQKNPKYPDFKHKSTGEALWVDGRSNPNWVISQLAILDSRMGSLQDKERKPVSFMYADDFMKSDANN
jgi:hypothetical protein